jgi:hypothetical protein
VCGAAAMTGELHVVRHADEQDRDGEFLTAAFGRLARQAQEQAGAAHRWS